MIWLKAFHVTFVITWFASLFYLPRLFVYHVGTKDAAGIERFKIMERRLFAMMTIGGTLAVTFGIAMVIVSPALLSMNWLRVKIVLVALLIAYHFMCYRLMIAFREDRNTHSERW
ncbi:MAG TPA: CopD family protein, partial [Steroidobacteraceae bacterium]|nr:CopD family protein [Steroidobacteraceae bacterium]